MRLPIVEGDRRVEFLVLMGQWWLAVFRPFGGGEGLTFHRWIFVRSAAASEGTLRHEAIHAGQYLRYGMLGFLARYLFWAAWVFVRRKPISEHPLEKPAYEV